MKKYFVLQRDFSNSDISIYEIKAATESEAWEMVENEITLNMSQEWLLEKDEFEQLRKKLNEVNL